MKIKILRGDRGKWYHNTDNIGKEFDIIDYSVTQFKIIDGYWAVKDDCVITELPESFCVKRCDDNNRDDWNKYLQWLNKQKNYPIPMFGGVDRYKYYGVNGENLHSDYLYPFGTEIHIDDIIKHIDFYSEPMVIESEEEFDMTTHIGRLAYAKRNYPVGTKYKSPVSGQELIVGDYDGHLNERLESLWLVYYNGKWAEIIDEVNEEELDMNTNEGRLAYAKKHYPVGTKYFPLTHQADLDGYHETVSESTFNPRWYSPNGKYIGIECGVGYIYANNKWAEIIDKVKEEKKMETNLLELIRLFPELPTDYAKKLVQKALEVKEGNLINLANFIGSADTPTPFYEIITGFKSEQKADYVWSKIYDFKNKKMETQRVSRQGLKEIHSVACSSWKSTLEEWGKLNPLEDYIELTDSQVYTMFLACSKEQLPIVSKYLKKDDGSVNVTKFKGTISDNLYHVVSNRVAGEYSDKSFCLNSRFNWEIKEDSKGILCLIPTKKKSTYEGPYAYGTASGVTQAVGSNTATAGRTV